MVEQITVKRMSTHKFAGKGPRSSLTDVPAVLISTSGKGGLSFCEDFRKQATPPEQIDALCFKHLTSSTTAMEDGMAAGSAGSVAEVSCASSTCSFGGNGNLSDGGSSNARSDRAISEQINAKLLKRTTSRHGRSSQRWVLDPSSHATIRLTTGVVPICRDGNVLFVSASSKPAWIFPKGMHKSDGYCLPRLVCLFCNYVLLVLKEDGKMMKRWKKAHCEKHLRKREFLVS